MGSAGVDGSGSFANKIHNAQTVQNLLSELNNAKGAVDNNWGGRRVVSIDKDVDEKGSWEKERGVSVKEIIDKALSLVKANKFSNPEDCKALAKKIKELDLDATGEMELVNLSPWVLTHLKHMIFGYGDSKKKAKIEELEKTLPKTPTSPKEMQNNTSNSTVTSKEEERKEVANVLESSSNTGKQVDDQQKGKAPRIKPDSPVSPKVIQEKEKKEGAAAPAPKTLSVEATVQVPKQYSESEKKVIEESRDQFLKDLSNSKFDFSEKNINRLLHKLFKGVDPNPKDIALKLQGIKDAIPIPEFWQEYTSRFQAGFNEVYSFDKENKETLKAALETFNNILAGKPEENTEEMIATYSKDKLNAMGHGYNVLSYETRARRYFSKVDEIEQQEQAAEKAKQKKEALEAEAKKQQEIKNAENIRKQQEVQETENAKKQQEEAEAATRIQQETQAAENTKKQQQEVKTTQNLSASAQVTTKSDIPPAPKTTSVSDTTAAISKGKGSKRKKGKTPSKVINKNQQSKPQTVKSPKVKRTRVVNIEAPPEE